MRPKPEINAYIATPKLEARRLAARPYLLHATQWSLIKNHNARPDPEIADPNKTELREFKYRAGLLHSEKALQYLGFLYDGQRKLLRSAALAKYSNHMKRGVKLAKNTQRKYNAIRFANGGAQKVFTKENYMIATLILGKEILYATDLEPQK